MISLFSLYIYYTTPNSRVIREFAFYLTFLHFNSGPRRKLWIDILIASANELHSHFIPVFTYHFEQEKEVMLKIFQIVIFSSASSTRNRLNLDKLLMLQTIFSHWSSVIALNSIMLSFYHLAGATHIHADHEVWRDLEPILGGLCASFQHKRSKKMWAHSNGQQFLNSCADWLSAKHVHALARTQKERERRIKNVGNGEIKRKYMCVPFSTLHMCRDIVTAKQTQT